MPNCWLAMFSDRPCDGKLIRAHLIPRQLLRREFGRTMARRMETDGRTWVWACGGSTGVGGHHGELDQAKRLRIARHALPPELEDFCREHLLTWWLEREYGPTPEEMIDALSRAAVTPMPEAP